jgi:hypothetical protein
MSEINKPNSDFIIINDGSRLMTVKKENKKDYYDNNGNCVNDLGIQICEWCKSENILDPISQEIDNGICNDCGSHW